MNKNKKSNKEVIAEMQEKKEQIEKHIARLKKQENSKRTISIIVYTILGIS